MTVKLNGSSSGSISIDAPANTTGGADIALTLPEKGFDLLAMQYLLTKKQLELVEVHHQLMHGPNQF